MIINYNITHNSTTTIQYLEDNVIMSTKSQAQNIPFFYKIVGEQNEKNNSSHKEKNSKVKIEKYKKKHNSK